MRSLSRALGACGLASLLLFPGTGCLFRDCLFPDTEPYETEWAEPESFRVPTGLERFSIEVSSSGVTVEGDAVVVRGRVSMEAEVQEFTRYRLVEHHRSKCNSIFGGGEFTEERLVVDPRREDEDVDPSLSIEDVPADIRRGGGTTWEETSLEDRPPCVLEWELEDPGAVEPVATGELQAEVSGSFELEITGLAAKKAARVPSRTVPLTFSLSGGKRSRGGVVEIERRSFVQVADRLR